jgi:hypothetical protein
MDALRYEKLKTALQTIAYCRSEEHGGYISRHKLVDIARKVLLECGHDFSALAQEEARGTRRRS